MPEILETFDRVDDELQTLKQRLQQAELGEAYQADVDRIREELEFVIEDYEQRERKMEAISNEH